MLILTRKAGECITIGDDIRIYILEIKGRQVRIGIEAPRDVAVHREEIFRLIRSRETPPPQDETPPPEDETPTESSK